MKKVHPDLNSNISNAESSSRMDLIKKFKDNKDILLSLCLSWGYVYEESIEEESENFNFPYANVEFRVSDYVSIEGEIWIINSIVKDKKTNKWIFSLENISTEAKKKVIRDSLNSGKDRKFYLYDVRKNTDKQIYY